MECASRSSSTGDPPRRPAGYRVRTALILTVLVGVLSLLVPAATATAQAPMQYAGPTTTTIQLVNVYGQVVGTPTYHTTVVTTIGPPKPRETNPFALVMQSDPLVNASGEWGLWSSSLVDGVTFQYWSYEMQRDGTLRGQLVDNHTGAAIALNLVTIPAEIAPNLTLPMTYAMANGTTITGTFTDRRLTFVINGNTVDQAHPFRIEGVLDRVR
jgi:hypothetical protein